MLGRTARTAALGLGAGAALITGLIAGPLSGAAANSHRTALAAPTAVAATAAKPAAACQPFAKTACLLPFPNNLFTKRDRSTPTGLRVSLPQKAMPVTKTGQAIGVSEYNRNDGFSPGSALIVHVPGLDNPAAFARTNPVGLLNMAQAFVRSQPIVVIDEQTGARQLIWSELDANTTIPADTNLLIHPGKDFSDGHTYIVALRNLRTKSGKTITAPTWFERLRDGKRLPKPEQSQKARYKTIFAALKRAGIGRSNLYEAWDFTVASGQNLTSRLLSIRNNAFAQLGDHNLADSTVEGHAPEFSVTSTSTLSPQLHDVQGTFSVPCYLVTCGESASTGFHYSSHNSDALPTQIPGNVATAQFECIIPSSATPANRARISLYGHGLLGSHGEVTAANVEAMATEHNMVFCATNWWGLAGGDVNFDIKALQNLNFFPAVIDRLQEGVLNTLFLGRLMLNPAGLASHAAFQSGGMPVIDTSHLYYDGNSQGGIEGGLTTAVAPDFRRAVLGVSGMNYGGVLLNRSTDFALYATFLYKSYVDPSMHPVILDLMQQLWDRGDPNGYAQFMTSHPLPDTPAHLVLMQIGYGDFQVSMYAAAVEARTIGASVYEPALDRARARDKNLFYGLPAIGSFPFNGSAIEIWDSGPGRVQPPPVANLAPVPAANNQDPHENPRSTPAARAQKSAFLEPQGAIVNICAGKPCHTSVFMP